MPDMTLVNAPLTANRTITFPDASGTISLGAGGLTFFTEAQSTTAPNATVYADSLTAVAAVANADAVFRPKGTGALLAQIPDSASTGGDKRGANAVDLQMVRTAASMVASGARSFMAGGQRNTCSQNQSAVVGGESNIVSGAGVQNGAVVGGQSNSVSNSQGFVGGGQQNQTFGGGASSGVVGGENNLTSATRSFIGGGAGNEILGTSCQRNAILGGNFNSITNTNALNSVILGGERATTFYQGEVAHANGRFAATGDAQTSDLVLRRAVTVGAPAVTMTLDDGVPTLINTLVLANNQAYQFTIRVIAKEATAGSVQCAWFNISGGIIRGTGVATTTVVGANVIDAGNAGGNSATWTCVAQANVTDGALQILVSAPAGTGTIRFVASVRLTRVAS